MQLSIENTKSLIRQIAKQFGVRVVFTRDYNVGGTWYPEEPNEVEITCLSSEQMIGALFHELGHWYAYHTGRFAAYHATDWTHPRNRRAVIATALNAERWVDEWGRKMCLKHFPKFQWEYSYRSPEQIRFLKDSMEEAFGE